MKRICYLLIVLTIVQILSCQVYAEDFYPHFIDIKCNSYNAYALTNDGDLYYWGEKHEANSQDAIIESMIITPELYAQDIKDFLPCDENPCLLKTNGSIWSGNKEQILPPGSADKLCFSYTSICLYKKDNKIFKISLSSKLSPVLVESDADDAQIGNGGRAILRNNDILQCYDFEENLNLNLDNVNSFDAFFATKLQYTTSYGVVKNDGTVWCADEESEWKPYMIMNDAREVFVFSPYYYIIDNGNVLWQYRTNALDRTILSKKRILENVLTIDMGYSSKYVAIKTDGTIWYWGNVIGQPIEHINRTGPGDIGEFQTTPVRLSFNTEENSAFSQQRLLLLLQDKEQREAYLIENYDYYVENYAKYFTTNELKEYKKYSKKASSEVPSVSQPIERTTKPAIAEVSSTTSAPLSMSLSTQDAQNNGTTSYVIIIIIGVVVLSLFALYFYLKKKN